MFFFCSCGKLLFTITSRTQHCEDTGHVRNFRCRTCNKCFGSEEARQQHKQAKGHFYGDETLCQLCYGCFSSKHVCKEHQVRVHHYCFECDRKFPNLNTTKQHLKSRIHRRAAIKCPFCSAKYATATGMTHHLEGGFCPAAPQMDRDEVYRLVRSKDPRGVITMPSAAWENTTPLRFVAGEGSWNGSGYGCSFCPHAFATREALDQHLNSPTHQEPLYRCPNRDCRVQCKTLGALINHLESEKCGAMRFETVQRRIEGIVSGSRKRLPRL